MKKNENKYFVLLKFAQIILNVSSYIIKYKI